MEQIPEGLAHVVFSKAWTYIFLTMSYLKGVRVLSRRCKTQSMAAH